MKQLSVTTAGCKGGGGAPADVGCERREGGDGGGGAACACAHCVELFWVQSVGWRVWDQVCLLLASAKEVAVWCGSKHSLIQLNRIYCFGPQGGSAQLIF